MLDKSTLHNLGRLDYFKLWLDSGVLTEINLAMQIQEHYRYRTLCHFLDNKLSIANFILQQIVEILKAAQDKAMSSAATLHLLKKKYLTNDQFDFVAIFLQTFGDWIEKRIDKLKSVRTN